MSQIRLIIESAMIALAFLPLPVSAITPQPAPRNSDGSSKLVDPDEQAERLMDQRSRSDQRTYGRSVLNSSSLVDIPDRRGSPGAAPLNFGPR